MSGRVAQPLQIVDVGFWFTFGATIGLVSPAGAMYFGGDLEEVEATLAAMGFQTKRGAHVLDTYGYLGGQDEARAADIMAMFTDPGVDALLPLRGGWGCARLLPHLDFDVIRAHPKIVCGYSDITALLSAMYTQSGLVGFHGPVGTSTWNAFSTGYWRDAVVEGRAVLMQDPPEMERETITPGRARGPLFGGNLTVLTALVGSVLMLLAMSLLFLSLFLSERAKPCSSARRTS